MVKKGKLKRILLWLPRILSILFATFITIFAFDVFGEGYGFWQTVLAFMMHLIPTFIIVLILIASWRRQWIGGILFIVLAAAYVILTWKRFQLSIYFAMCGPLVLIGILFFLNTIYNSVNSRKGNL